MRSYKLIESWWLKDNTCAKCKTERSVKYELEGKTYCNACIIQTVIEEMHRRDKQDVYDPYGGTVNLLRIDEAGGLKVGQVLIEMADMYGCLPTFAVKLTQVEQDEREIHLVGTLMHRLWNPEISKQYEVGDELEVGYFDASDANDWYVVIDPEQACFSHLNYTQQDEEGEDE